MFPDDFAHYTHRLALTFVFGSKYSWQPFSSSSKQSSVNLPINIPWYNIYIASGNSLHLSCFPQQSKVQYILKLNEYSLKTSKGPFTNTCKGGRDAKNIYRKHFSGPPLQTAKKFQAPLFVMKITGQPHRKACKLNFNGKSVVIFFSGPPLQGSTILRAPFLHQAPPYKCLWTVPNDWQIMKTNNLISLSHYFCVL